jgi:carbonic anhydrase
MAAAMDSVISRRNLLRLGAFSGLATALLPALGLGEAQAGEVICNPDRPTTPAGALQALVDGNDRWATFTQEHPGEDAMRRTCVAENGQTPFAAIISCSDSRVPPELLFDQGIGDLFVARVAGNGANGTLTESLYYGTEHLDALVLFVLGHSDCGAVKAAVASFPRHALEFVNLIFPAVKKARKIVKKAGGDPNDPTQVVPVATEQNVILGVQRLRKSKFFKKDVQAGTPLIAGGVYDLGTQQVNIVIQ